MTHQDRASDVASRYLELPLWKSISLNTWCFLKPLDFWPFWSPYLDYTTAPYLTRFLDSTHCCHLCRTFSDSTGCLPLCSHLCCGICHVLFVRVLQGNRTIRLCVCVCVVYKDVHFKELAFAVVGTGESEIHRANGQAENSGRNWYSVSRQNLIFLRETSILLWRPLAHWVQFQVTEGDLLTWSQSIIDIHNYKTLLQQHLY